MYRRMSNRLAGGASAVAMSMVGGCATMCVLMMAGPAQAQQAPAEATIVPPQGTILSPIVVKTPKNAGPSAPPSQPGPSGSATPTSLDALSTSSEKAAVTIYDAPGTVTVKSTAEMERQNINSARDFIRDEPGISVGNQPTRTGATNFVIRGIGENRVRIEIDGLKVPDFPGSNIGAGTYTRDFIDYDALKRVEIIRGPASALYGSDAIGGVVAFITKDPADYLDLVGKNWYFSIKGGYDSLDKSVYSTVTGASRIGAVESMVLVTRRWGEERDINSKKRNPNPQDYTTTNVLSKIVHNTSGMGQFTLTGEQTRKEVGTTLLTDLTATVRSSEGDDESVRRRLSLDWNAPVRVWFADAFKAKIYMTDVNREEITQQRRISAGQARYRFTDLDYEQTIYGGELQFAAKRRLLGGEHFFTYGATVDFTSTSRPRFRYETNLVTNVTTTTVAGETFPNKNFPDTDTTQAALYFQDIARYGALRIIPAVRFDFFGLKVNPDAAFANSNTGGFAIHDQQETAISPKLGATYDLNDTYRLFGQYARGFRAPPYDNANFGFTNPLQGYQILPNGNLSPETSDGFEGGLRGRFRNGSSFQVSAFYNMYQDFIDTVVVSQPPATPLINFQYQNISNVTIWGFEGKGEWKFIPQWALFGSFAYARGENEETNKPLDSVDPFTAVAGVRYRSLNSGWGGEFRTRFVAEKNRVSEPNYVKPDAHTMLDALVSYEVAPSFTFNAGVFNIFDASYFNPQDVVGVLSTNTNLELLRAPGRTFSANATFRW